MNDNTSRDARRAVAIIAARAAERLTSVRAKIRDGEPCVARADARAVAERRLEVDRVKLRMAMRQFDSTQGLSA